MKIFFILVALILICNLCIADDLWKITAYCSCIKCCGKSDGITASGDKAQFGYVACNWLPFGTLVDIEGFGIFIVKDRGSVKHFGSKKNKIKHLDMWLPRHEVAKKFGVQYRKVEICGQEADDNVPVLLTAQHKFVRVKKLKDF